MEETSTNNNINSYEQVVKKLIQIFQFKHTDNVKQLEDLWDSINASPMREEQNGVNKRQANQMSSSSSEAKRSKITKSGNSSLVVTKLNPSPPKLNGVQVKATVSKVSIDSTDQSSSSSSTSSSTTCSDSNFNLKTDFDAEMLDFSCYICKQINQETNNKLIECKKCTKLYHQNCHQPKIEQTKTIQGIDDKMAWYMEKCQMCSNSPQIENEEDEQTRMSDASTSSSCSITSLSNLSTNQTSQKSPVKGLAALATKINSTASTVSQQNGKNVDLFKKFKQSAPNNALDSSNSSSSSSNNSASSKFSASKASSVSSTTSKPRNIFNLNSTSLNSTKNQTKHQL